MQIAITDDKIATILKAAYDESEEKSGKKKEESKEESDDDMSFGTLGQGPGFHWDTDFCQLVICCFIVIA